MRIRRPPTPLNLEILGSKDEIKRLQHSALAVVGRESLERRGFLDELVKGIVIHCDDQMSPCRFVTGLNPALVTGLEDRVQITIGGQQSCPHFRRVRKHRRGRPGRFGQGIGDLEIGGDPPSGPFVAPAPDQSGLILTILAGFHRRRCAFIRRRAEFGHLGRDHDIVLIERQIQ